MRKRLGVFCCLTSIILFLSPSAVHAQTNVWTNPVSGKWEDASSWSLGILPGTNQTILVTNAGWKALAIDPNTAQNFPQTLTINALTVSSPNVGTVNTLLMNYSGQTPLTLNSLSIGANCALIMEESSLLASGAISMAGICNLTNSTLSAATESASGNFNQQGGTNAANLTLSGSEYNLFDGVFNGGIDIESGTFNQIAGTNVSSSVGIGGPRSGTGSYTLSNGVLAVAGGLGINFYAYIQYYHLGYSVDSYGSSFYQAGGICTNNGIYFNEPYNWPHTPSSYTLADGILITPSITLNLDCVFSQSGGTNYVGNISDDRGSYGLFGGWLMAGTIQLLGGYYGSPFYQSGGTNQISGNLLIDSGADYILAGGQLTVPDIQLSGTFEHAGGNLSIPGMLSIANGIWAEETSGQQFGPLQLGAGANSILSLETNPCVMKFADSSSLVWSNAADLAVQNWSGSLYGGGQQQIIFGSNSSALTPQQLSQIQFQNPAGLSSGNYPARILATGELVPDTGAPLPLKMSVACAITNGSVQLNLCGDIGQSCDIEVSTDLVNWTWWTNQFNSNGTISTFDCATNSPQRFYRAHVAP